MSKRFEIRPYGTGVILTIAGEDDMVLTTRLTAEEAKQLCDLLYKNMEHGKGKPFPSDVTNLPSA